MGLYLLNISVDTADPDPEYIPEDLSFNDQESIVEIIIEQVLGYEDAIKEYDDHDTESHHKNNHLKIDLLADIVTTHHFLLPLMKNRSCHPDYEAALASGFREIDSPPPRIWFVSQLLLKIQ